MLTVEQIAEEIVAREGGYVNDPDDPGGRPSLVSRSIQCGGWGWI